MIGYHVPPAGDPDLRALEVAVAVLSRGRSSRLYRSLVRDRELALDYDVSIDELLDPGLAVAYLQARDGVPIAKVEAAYHVEVARLRSEPVRAAELARAQRFLVADHLRSIETVSGRGDRLAWCEAVLGDATRIDAYPGEIAAVRPRDVQRVASRHLRAANRTVVTLVPRDDAGEG
jgi:zinc protease